MKKYISCILSIAMIFLFIGCTQKKAENVREKDRFDIKEANKIVDAYIKSITDEKYDEASRLLTEKVKSNTGEIKPNDLKIKGYKTEEMTESGGEGSFRVKVVKSNASNPETQVLDYRIKVIKDGIDYKINEIKTSNFKEAFKDFDSIRIRKENSVETYLVTKFDGLPKYAYSKDDNAKMKSQVIPKDNYGIITLDYTGDLIALSTIGSNNTFVGILTFDDAVSTQGGAGGSKKGEGDQGDQQGGKDQQGGAEGKNLKEKPIGKELISCDIIENGKLENMVFSKDEKLLAVQYTKGNNKSIKVYNVGSGDLIKTKFEEEYPLGKVDVIFMRFEKEKMLYRVLPKNEQDKNNEYVGDWELDLKSFKIKKAE